MNKKPTAGLRHLALNVINLEACITFYVNLLGMHVDWAPDRDHAYLTSGNDILALHQAPDDFKPNDDQKLNHLGFILDSAEAVDQWHDHFVAQHVDIKAAPKTHRDGARSFYCADPDGNVVQLIYHPSVGG